MRTESDLVLADGRLLHVHDSGPDAGELAVFWHHGTPQTGRLPDPMVAAGAELGIRWVSLDRPGYLTSSPLPDRDIAAVAADAAAVADELGIARFAALGYSGGGPHALACAALLPDRVLAVGCLAALAPRDAAGLDFFAGMAPAGVAELHAAEQGREALARHLATIDFDPEQFTPADHAALAGEWSSVGQGAMHASSGGPEGMLADNLAYVRPWGFDPATITVPILLAHGDADRVVPFAHGEWLAEHCRTAELLRSPGDGHVSIHRRHRHALEWLIDRVATA
jgi:pimeloyl-ACP methyl ester carboxylesterase